MIGYLARSKSGHDTGSVYLIVGEQNGTVFLADGKLKTFDNPKKKNRKHIELIKKYENPEVTEKLLRGEAIDDIYIKQEVKHVKSGRN